MRWRAVTFDAAGTLIAPGEPVGATYARVAVAHGIAADADAVEVRFRRAFAVAPPLAFPQLTTAALPAAERAWWREIVRAALDVAATAPALDACLDALWDHYAGAGAWRVFADVPATLVALRAHGLRLGVVSNFDRRLEPLLVALGLRDAFDVVVASTACGAAKPDARIFGTAAVALQVAAGDALHVGDDPAADVDGARHAGWGALRIDRHGHAADAIDDLRQLLPHLGAAHP